MTALLNNLAAFLFFVAIPPIVSSNNIDLGGLLNQATGGIGGLDPNLLNNANGSLDLNNIDLGSILNQVEGQGQGQDPGEGQEQGEINQVLQVLNTILVKDENGKVKMNETLNELQKFGFTLKDLLKAAGLGENPQVLALAEQFITAPDSLNEGNKAMVCEAMETLMEDRTEVVSSLATLGILDTTTLCTTR